MKKFLVLSLLLMFNASGKSQFDMNLGATFPIGTKFLSDSVDTGMTANLNFRHYLSERFSLGLGYHFLDFEKIRKYDQIFHLLGTYDFSANTSFTPYLSFGLGFATVTWGTQKYTKPAALLGVGFRKEISKKFLFNMALNYHHIQKKFANRYEQHILAPVMGITYNFGGDESKVVEETPVEEEEMEEKVVPVVDTDHDGVADENDQCLNTPEGSKVNALGCLEAEEIKIRLDVKFASGTAKINTEITDQIDRLAMIMQKHEKLTVEIQGHTDDRGKRSYNQYISKKRASAVKKYLVNKHGIDAARLSVKGYGPDYPIVSNSSKAGRSQNRRVEAKVLSID